MAIFKCKMCGGALEISEDITVAECEYCGSKQTVPTKKDEVITNLFNRANNLRLKNEFDKAAEVYSKILNENDADAEAHWGLVLCKYGIEYVEDPKTYKRIPTCHRTQYTSVLSDTDYLAAIENADVVSKEVYTAEAHEIAELQKSILAIVKDEKPFDVFICYKETDENGKRTVDSTLANDIYYQLTKEGMRVFYAAITLEDKLGVEYEPYIFAALNSAKVMLAIGTKPEYFNAVWVKNEWSRYLGIMKTDREKMLIPCYRDMDAYDLPEEFAHLQAQDMSKIGFINDLVRGIKKVTQADDVPATVVKETVVTSEGANTATLLERVFMFLEDGDWNSADEYCEKVLDIDPKNAQAYLGKLMAELRVRKQDALKNCAEPFDGNNNYHKILRFGDETLNSTLVSYTEFIIARNENTRLTTTYNNAKQKMASANSEEAYKKAAREFKSISEYKDSASLAEECLVRAENARLEGIYAKAKKMMSRANTESAYKEAAQLFETISEFKDSAELIKNCYEKAEIARKDAILEEAKAIKVGENISKFEEVITLLKPISGHKDADELIVFCEEKIAKIKAEAEQERIKAENTKKQIIKISKIVIPIVCVAIIVAVLINNVIIPNSKYKNALALMDEGKYSEALTVLEEIDGYKDSSDKILDCKYEDAVALVENGKYLEAIAAFEALDGHKDSEEISKKIRIKVTARESLSGGFSHAVGLKSDGTVVAVGSYSYGKCNVSDWKDIVAISVGESHTVGLKSDGTVVAVGDNDDGQCNVSAWKDIVAISAAWRQTIGLKSDGTVVAVGYNSYGQCNVSAWKDIVAISAGSYHTVGLKSDGTVLATGYWRGNADGQCNVSYWKDIVAISAGEEHTVGLKSDGTVVAVGSYSDGKCNVSKWKDIVAISADWSHTVGLKSDGTVVAVGNNDDGQCNVSKWKDIVAISAYSSNTVGLKSDGTVVAVGDNDDGQCDVSDWEDIKLPDKI